MSKPPCPVRERGYITANIQRAGTPIAVTAGMPVQVADQVVVSTGGKVTITLSDESILEVGSSSTIVIDEELLGPGGARASTRVHLLAGILRSVAKHTSAGALPNFEVLTPNAILAARGTTFDTQYTGGTRRFGYGATTQFTDERTLKGTVGARNAAGGEEVSVSAGYETTIAGDSAPTSPRPINLTGIHPVTVHQFSDGKLGISYRGRLPARYDRAGKLAPTTPNKVRAATVQPPGQPTDAVPAIAPHLRPRPGSRSVHQFHFRR